MAAPFPPDSRLVDRVRPSPNFGARAPGKAVDMVLLHYTGWPDAAVYPILAVTGLLWLIFALLPPRGTGNKRDRRR